MNRSTCWTRVGHREKKKDKSCSGQWKWWWTAIVWLYRASRDAHTNKGATTTRPPSISKDFKSWHGELVHPVQCGLKVALDQWYYFLRTRTQPSEHHSGWPTYSAQQNFFFYPKASSKNNPWAAFRSIWIVILRVLPSEAPDSGLSAGGPRCSGSHTEHGVSQSQCSGLGLGPHQEYQ